MEGGGGRWNGSPETDESRECRTVAISLITETIWDGVFDGVAEFVERPNAGEGERGAFMEMRERAAKLRAMPGD